MAQGDAITSVDSVAVGTTTVQPAAGDVWRITSLTASASTDLEYYDGANAATIVTEFGNGQSNISVFIDNSAYAQWNNTGCAGETHAYSGQKVVE